MITQVIVTFIDLFVPAFSAVLLIRVVLSYFVQPHSRLMEFLMSLTEPILAPIRRVLPQTPGIDFTPLAALLILQALQYLIHMLL